jgi:hypothetical protein
MKHKMISRWVLVVIALMIVGALVTGVVLASAESGTSDQSAVTKISGGRYQLTTRSSPVNAVAAGGGYQLAPLATPVVVPASGCCCKTNLPCVLRQ